MVDLPTVRVARSRTLSISFWSRRLSGPHTALPYPWLGRTARTLGNCRGSVRLLFFYDNSQVVCWRILYSGRMCYMNYQCARWSNSSRVQSSRMGHLNCRCARWSTFPRGSAFVTVPTTSEHAVHTELQAVREFSNFVLCKVSFHRRFMFSRTWLSLRCWCKSE